MELHEWCISVLKGKNNGLRMSELYNLCTKHYSEQAFDGEDELLAALRPFMEYFVFEDFRYSYVTFEDDGQRDAPVLELAKEVLRSHSDRYTLSVFRRKMEEAEGIYGRHYAGATAGGQTGQQVRILPV